MFQLLFFVKILTTYDNSAIFEYYLELIQMTRLIVGYFKTFWELHNEMAIYLMIGSFFAGFLHVFIH